MSEAFLRLPLVELERLLAAVQQHRLAAPVTEAALIAQELRAALPFVSILATFSSALSLRTFLECVVSQRRTHEARPLPELVWSGPEPEHGRARHTAVVVRELFERAQREVFIAGYSFQGGAEVLDPLRDSMARRGVHVEILLDGSGVEVYAATEPDEVLRRLVDEFLSKTWNDTERVPTLFCDPRTLLRVAPTQVGGRWFPPHSMHAKCIVVDRVESLVGSANFTARAHASNIEVGVLIRDAAVAEALLHQWIAVRPMMQRIALR